MSRRVTIDVEARFIDNVSDESVAASKSLDEIGKSADDARKKVEKMAKTKARIEFDANNSKLVQKLRQMEERARKLGKEKFVAKLEALDKATVKINKLIGTAKSWAAKKYLAFLDFKDSASKTLSTVMSLGRKFASKTWTAAVKIKDLATAPLRGIKNMLFSIKSLVLAITAGMAANKFILNPINLADAYASTQIGFSTLLGEAEGQQMMDKLDELARVTPFKTSGVISSAQKMMAYGWDAERIVEDMKTIGDAAAATGKGTEGLESIVYAMSEIRSKGKLSTQELNQLAGAGIKAKAYLAEGMGYGTSDAGMAKLAKDLEDGVIGANQAIELILEGMKEFDGMMDRTANETVEGLWSQITDTFEINIFRKWGQGLQDGAKRGFGSVVTLLDEAQAGLEKFGDMLYDIGKVVSNWTADKLENLVEKVNEITGTYEFSEGTLGEKISLLWKGLVSDPLKEWWETGGQEKTAATAGKIGAWIGEMLTKGLLAIFGATDVLADSKIGVDGGMTIAQSFVSGFLDNFDGSAITDAFVDAISNVWGALPTWAKVLVGGYGVGKLGQIGAGAINLWNTASPLVGHVGTVHNKGTGLMGGMSALGYKLVGGASTGVAAPVAAGAAMGAIATGAGLVHMASSAKKAYEAKLEGDTTTYKAETAKSVFTGVGMVGGGLLGMKAGAALGTLVGGPAGTLIGAGLGTLVGWFAGDKIARNIEAAKYESEAMQEAIKDSETSAEELSQIFEQAKWENAKEHFGDIKLSLSEIQRLADQIVWGDDMQFYESFSMATENAKASLDALKSSAETVNKWMWKASLGVKFNEDEIESIVLSVDDYINDAKSYVENKHYEFTAAVSMLVDTGSGAGKGVLDSGNAFYTQLQKQLDDLSGKLSNKVELALKDGVITLDEQKEITNLQNQIAEILDKVATAEYNAELTLVNVKFGEGNLDKDSFDTFMSTMNETLSERMTALDDAFTVSVSSLQLQLADGAITQEEYDAQLAELVSGYTAKVDAVKAEVFGIELKIIGDAYKTELGADAAAKLQEALQYSIDNDLDPVTLSNDKLAELLKVEELSSETAGNIKDMLSGVFAQAGAMQIDSDILLKIGTVTPDATTGEKVQTAIDQATPDDVSETVNVNVTGAKRVLNTLKLSQSDFGIRSSYSASTTVNVTPKYNFLNGTVAGALIKKVDGTGNGPKARGGIVGGTSAQSSFARGGIVGGSTRFIRVNEESPEMIIPLSSQRRERAMKLWSKTGQLLNVPGFARGGRTDGNDEGIRFGGFSTESASGGQEVMVEIGGITVAITVQADGQTNIAEAIKAQANEIAETVAGVLADAFTAQFENTPTRGGVA